MQRHVYMLAKNYWVDEEQDSASNDTNSYSTPKDLQNGFNATAGL